MLSFTYKQVKATRITNTNVNDCRNVNRNIDQERSLCTLSKKTSPISTFFLTDGRRGRKAMYILKKRANNFYGLSDGRKEDN